jgi:hypothetical protein
VIIQNSELFVRVVVLGQLSIQNRVTVLLAMYPFLGTSFTLSTALLITVISLLIGIDVALITFHFREQGISSRTGTSGTVGTVGALLGALGAGCVVCGTSLLTGLLSLIGVSGGILILPFEGLEFAIVAVVFVVLSIFWVSKGMDSGIRKRELRELSD